MSEFTPKYNLEKPSQDDFYDVDVHNKNMERIEEQLSLNEEAVKNMDVSASITNVINERVNADTSKPLSTLISEWINTAKTALLNAVSTLTTHVTSQHTGTKQHVSTELNGTNRHITDSLTGTNNHITACKDNINATVNSARDNIKSHITSQIGSAKNDYSGRVATPYAFYQGDTKFQQGTNVITLASLSGSGVFILTKAHIKYSAFGGTSGMTYTHATEVIIDGKTYSDLILSDEVISLPIPFNTSLVIRRVVNISANTGSGYFNYAGTKLHGMLYR